MKRTLISYAATALFIGSASLTSAAIAGQDNVVQTSGNISFVSGGVGTESIDQLNAQAREFNLKLVFALKSGEYVSGVRVVITDTKGMALIDTTTEGPWFLAKLPAGKYRIEATLSGKAVKQNTAVGSEKLKTIQFRWSSE